MNGPAGRTHAAPLTPNRCPAVPRKDAAPRRHARPGPAGSTVPQARFLTLLHGASAAETEGVVMRRAYGTFRPERRITPPSVPSAGCGPARAAPDPPTRRGWRRYAPPPAGPTCLVATLAPTPSRAGALVGPGTGCGRSGPRTVPGPPRCPRCGPHLQPCPPANPRTPRHSESAVLADSESKHRVSPPVAARRRQRQPPVTIALPSGPSASAPCVRRCRHLAAFSRSPPPAHDGRRRIAADPADGDRRKPALGL